MRSACRCITFLFVFSTCIATLLPQNFDYHREESPAVGWTGASYHDPRMLACGGVSLMAARGFAAAVNPALLAGENQIGISGSTALVSYEAFQYYGVNNGVLIVPDGFRDNAVRFSGLALTLPLGRFGLSAGWRLHNILALPSFEHLIPGWEYKGDFSGGEDTFFTAVSWRPGHFWSFGVRLDYTRGKRSLELSEAYLSEGGGRSTIIHAEEHVSEILIPAAGISVSISPSWLMAASYSHPLNGEVERRVTRSLSHNWSPEGFRDIETATDRFHRPASLRMSTAVTPFRDQNLESGDRWTVAAEAVLVWWSSYEFEYFSEALRRDMRNTLSLRLAVERAWGGADGVGEYFLRLGYRYDPQPVRNPADTLHGVSCGLGMTGNGLSLDLGIAYHLSTGEGVGQDHFLCAAAVFIPLKKGE